MTLSTVIALLLQYKYALLLPLSVIEGPILIIIGGFLVSTGVFNPILVFIIVVIGDILGDSGLYALGRFGSKFIHRHGHRIGVTTSRIEEAKLFFANHHKKAVTFSKLFHGVGFVGLLVAGSLKISYSRYFFTCLTVTLIQSVILLEVGILFGHAYNTFAVFFDRWVSFAFVAAGIALVVFAFYRFKSKPIKSID